jgi:hypothetical protein
VKSSSTTLKSVKACGTAFIEPVALPSQTPYAVSVDPGGITTGSGTVKLYTVVDTSGTTSINGGGVPVTVGTPGQLHQLTFSGTAGQLVTVRLTGNTIGTTTVSLLNGQTTLKSSQQSGASFNLAQATLPADGTYTVVIDPLAQRTGSITVSVTNP